MRVAARNVTEPRVAPTTRASEVLQASPPAAPRRLPGVPTRARASSGACEHERAGLRPHPSADPHAIRAARQVRAGAVREMRGTDPSRGGVGSRPRRRSRLLPRPEPRQVQSSDEEAADVAQVVRREALGGRQPAAFLHVLKCDKPTSQVICAARRDPHRSLLPTPQSPRRFPRSRRGSPLLRRSDLRRVRSC